MPDPYAKLRAKLARLPGADAARFAGLTGRALAASPPPPRLERSVAPAQAMVAAASHQAAPGAILKPGQGGVSVMPAKDAAALAAAKQDTRQSLEDYLWDQARADYMKAPNPAPETAPVEVGKRKKK